MCHNTSESHKHVESKKEARQEEIQVFELHLYGVKTK